MESFKALHSLELVGGEDKRPGARTMSPGPAGVSATGPSMIYYPLKCLNFLSTFYKINQLSTFSDIKLWRLNVDIEIAIVDIAVFAWLRTLCI